MDSGFFFPGAVQCCTELRVSVGKAGYNQN